MFVEFFNYLGEKIRELVNTYFKTFMALFILQSVFIYLCLVY